MGPLAPKDKTQLEERLKRTVGPPSDSPRKVENSAPLPAPVTRITSGMGRPSSPSSTRIGGIPRPASPQVLRSPESVISPPRTRTLVPSRLGAPKSRPLSVSQARPPPETQYSPPTQPEHQSTDGSLTLIEHDVGNDAGADVSLIISSILSADPSRSVEALKKVQEILRPLKDDEKPSAAFMELSEHTEGLIETITLQMSQVFERGEDLSEPSNFRLAKHLIQTLNSFCDHAVLPESLSEKILTGLFEELTNRLLQTDESSETKVKDLSRFINMIVLRLFNTSRRIAVFK